MPREDEGVRAGRNVCRAWVAGGCEFGDSCIFSHALAPRGPKRETIGSRAAAAQGAAPWSDTDSAHGSSSSSYNGRSTSRGRSWADLSQDTWPEDSLPQPGGAAVRARVPQGFELSGWRLPSFGDRLSFPEFFPSAGPPANGGEKAPQSKTARRRKQRELADRRAEFRDTNTKLADMAVAAALAFGPCSAARPQPHLEFPRSEAASPPRPPAPCPTPRPPDRPNYKAYDGARGDPEQEEDEEVPEHQPGHARQSHTESDAMLSV